MGNNSQPAPVGVLCRRYHGYKRNNWTGKKIETLRVEVFISNGERECSVYCGTEELVAARIADALGEFFKVQPQLIDYDQEEAVQWKLRDPR